MSASLEELVGYHGKTNISRLVSRQLLRVPGLSTETGGPSRLGVVHEPVFGVGAYGPILSIKHKSFCRERPEGSRTRGPKVLSPWFDFRVCGYKAQTSTPGTLLYLEVHG